MIRIAATGVALVMAIFISLVAGVAPANASSDYDNIVQVTPSLTTYTDWPTNTQEIDISGTWWTDLQQAERLRVEEHIGGWTTNFVTELKSIIANGGSYGVYKFGNQSQGYTITVVGTSDPNAYCEFDGPASSGVFQCVTHAGYSYVRQDYFTYSTFGTNGCYGGDGWNHCADDGMAIYENPLVLSGGPYTLFYAPYSSLSNYQFYFMNFDIHYPTGYEGATIPQNRMTPPSYVAMGDSYSSGEGNAPYESTTNTQNDKCHRSNSGSYPEWLTQYSGLNLSLDYVACSGATTDTLLNGGSGNGAWDEGPQIDNLSSSTQKVTLTIGGNDLGFKSVLNSCVKKPSLSGSDWGCSTDSNLQSQINDRLSALNGTAYSNYYEPENGHLIHSIQSVIEAITAKAPGASIYIAGYPKLFGASTSDYDSNSTAPGGYVCTVTATATVSYDDAQWLNDQADNLNTVINAAVTVAEPREST